MDEVKEQIPVKQQTIMCQLDHEHWIEYKEAERDLVEYLKNFKNATDEKIARSLRGEVMVRIGILRNISARGKLKDVFSFLENIVQSGEKIVVFANLHEIFDRLTAKFPNAVTITGRDSAEQRDANKLKFQNDPNQKLIFCNLRTGGEGINLSSADTIGFIEFGWTAKDMDQAGARIVDYSKNKQLYSYYFAGKNTIDEYMLEVINNNREMSNEVTGGTTNVEEEVIEGLINLFFKKDESKESGTIIDNVNSDILYIN